MLIKLCADSGFADHYKMSTDYDLAAFSAAFPLQTLYRNGYILSISTMPAQNLSQGYRQGLILSVRSHW